MRSSLKRWTVLGLAAATVSSALMAGGCGSAEADQSVRDSIIRSQQAQRKGGEEGHKEAQQILEDAVKNADASPASKAQAKSALGQLQLEAARDTLRDASRYEVEAGRLALEIAQLANLVGRSNTLVEGYKKNDPQKVKDSINQRIAEAQGGGDKSAWFTHEKSTIPTLATVKQTISQLEGQIAQKQDALKQLDQQRVQTLEEAEKVNKASSAAKGQEAVDAFKKAADLRKKAADLAVQIDQGNAALAPMKGDLAVAQGQEKILNDVIAQLKEQAQQLDASWQNVQSLIGAQSKVATEIVGTAGATSAPSEDLSASGKSIAEKAAIMAHAAQQADELRENAIASLREASKQFEDAKAAATALQQDVRTKQGDFQGKPQDAAWKTELAVLNPNTFELQRATAQRLLGDALAARGTSLHGRVQLADYLAPIFTKANLQIPEQLQSGDMSKREQEAFTLADEAYNSSDEALGVVSEGSGTEDLKNAARIQRIFELYGRAHASKIAGQPQKADQYLATAKQAVTDLKSQDAAVSIPPLPGELAALNIAPTTAPTPASAPAAASAPTAAPAPAPTEPGAATPAPAPADAGTAPAPAPADTGTAAPAPAPGAAPAEATPAPAANPDATPAPAVTPGNETSP
jgi:hypothetical protein